VENHQILVFDPYLELESAFGNYGSYQGQMDTPMGVCFAPSGDVVVADTGNHRLQWFSDGGAFRRAVPTPGRDNPLRRPRRVVVDDDGRAYVADPTAGAVFVFGPSGELEREVAPSGVSRFSPTDVARTRTGDVYVTDEANRSVYVFRGL
jgi:tripartite motif-containing protein 71